MNSMVPQHILERVDRAHQDGQRVVLVTGVFDILHREHENFLRKAKAIGDVLIVAIESDVRVRHLKGDSRPVNTAEKRVAALHRLGIADEVFVLPDQFGKPEDHEELIREIRPMYLAVSSHSPYIEKKRLILEKFGGTVEIVHEHNPAISTTQILAARHR